MTIVLVIEYGSQSAISRFKSYRAFTSKIVIAADGFMTFLQIAKIQSLCFWQLVLITVKWTKLKILTFIITTYTYNKMQAVP